MYYNDNTIVFYDGAFKKVNEVNVNYYSQSLHYGLGVFEGIRAYDTPNGLKIFKGKEHFERLRHSAKTMQIEFNYTVDDLLEISEKVLQKNGFKSGYIRPLITMGCDMSLRVSKESHFFLCAWEWGKYLGKDTSDIIISSYQRPNPKACHMDTKTTGHYINSILARMEAEKAGADEALLLDMNGHVAEATGENIFFQKNGKVYTPALGSILPGITRATIMEIAKKNGIEIIEKTFYPDELFSADAAFFTGTAVEVGGINSIDRKQFPLAWEKSIGYTLAQKFREYVNS
jgi:branched-chain amino acid aminotransferase